MSRPGWTWDASLYRGSAAYYASGRLAYPVELASELQARLGLDGTGRLLDVGCGPGSVTISLAPLFAEVVGVDADADMVAEAKRRARDAGVPNARWFHLRAEDLPAGLGTFHIAGFAQSFHWMDRARVAVAVRGMLEPTGAWVHIGATTHEGAEEADVLPHPQPPRGAMRALVVRYLGSQRRAGCSVLPTGEPPSGEDAVIRAAGFTEPQRLEIGGGVVHERTEDEIVASVFSLSSAAPHLFGGRVAEFEAELRRLLRGSSPQGSFCEVAQPIAVTIWRT